MKMKTANTEVMTIARDERKVTILMYGQQLKPVKEFTYLWSIISADAEMNKEIQHRCNLAYQILGQMSPILQNKHVNVNTKNSTM